jgi:hypothetical protein
MEGIRSHTLTITPMILRLIAEIDLTGNHIKQLHGQLLAHSTKDERHRGHYKTHPNNVEAFDSEAGASALSLKPRHLLIHPAGWKRW